MNRYEVWRGNKLELYATFYSLEEAKRYVAYKARYECEECIITQDNSVVYSEE